MKSVLLSTVAVFALSGAAKADINLWVDDTSGNIGLVDLTTKTVSMVNNTGQALTDIAFVGNQMFGTTFTGLFKINDATGTSTLVGNYSVGGDGMNALVGDGTNLLAASNATTETYLINPTTAGATNFANSVLPSAGDLAFSGKTLFLSATNAAAGDSLVNVSSSSVVGAFSPTESSVFGLANDGTTTYAIDGTEVFTVNTATAVLTPLFNYGGLSALGDANGTAFIAEGPSGAVPEPSTWAMLLLGFGGLAFFAKRKMARLAI
jgi:PEP-CTERM motif